MANTTNFGWETPDDTDLVKDGAAAMRTLGNSIDASFVDLKGGTTGQVLAKASNTDLDFTWATDASGIPATIFDAKGDIIAASAADTAARLAVGANNTVLTADSSTATGLKWASPAVNANFTLLNSGGTTLSGSTTTVSGISGADKIFILIEGADNNVGSSSIGLRLNADSGTNYDTFAGLVRGSTTWSSGLVTRFTGFNGTSFTLAESSTDAGSTVVAYAMIDGCNSSGLKPVTFASGVFRNNPGVDQANYTGGGVYKGTSTISSVSLITNNSFDGGTIYVYTSAQELK